MKKIITALILLCTSNTMVAQDIQWVTDVQFKYFDSKTNHKTALVSNTIDKAGSYIKAISFADTLSLFGKTYYPMGSQSLLIVRFNSNGNYKWSITLKAQKNIILRDLIADDSGNISIIGDYEGKMYLPTSQVFDTFQYNRQGYIIKFDSMGNIVWAKNHRYDGQGFTYKIANDKQGNLYFYTRADIVFALTADSSFFISSFAIVKFDNIGNIVMRKLVKPESGNFSVSGNGKFMYVFSEIVGGSKYISNGDTLINTYPKNNYVISAFDGMGNNIYNRMVAANVFDGYEVLPRKSLYVDDIGNCYFTYRHNCKVVEAGNTFPASQLPVPIWMKIDINKNILWAVSTNDSTGSGFSGLMGVMNNGTIYSHLRTKQEFNLNSIFCSTNSDFILHFDTAGKMFKVSEISHYTGGYGSSLETDGTDFWVQIYDSIEWNGQLYGKGKNNFPIIKYALSPYSMSVKDILKANKYYIYPNPSSGIFTIAYNTSQKASLTIYNTLGEHVYNTTWNNDTSKTLDLSYLAKGIYFLRLGEETQRIVIE